MQALTFNEVSWPSVCRLAAGYTVACAAAAVSFGLVLSARTAAVDGVTPAMIESFVLGTMWSALGIFALSLPTFLVLRGLLHLGRRSDPVSFALSGAVNGYGLVSLVMGADTWELYFRYPPDPVFALIGGIGGVACWRTERRMVRTASGA
jgi:hypothetical protein